MYLPLETILKTKITQPLSVFQNTQKKVIPNFIKTTRSYSADLAIIEVTDVSIEKRFEQLITYNSKKRDYSSSEYISGKLPEFTVDPEHWVLFYSDKSDKVHQEITKLIIAMKPFIFSELKNTSEYPYKATSYIKYSERFFDPTTMSFGKVKEIRKEVLQWK